MIDFVLTVLRNSDFSFVLQLLAAECLIFIGKKMRRYGVLCLITGTAAIFLVSMLWKTTAIFPNWSTVLATARYMVLYLIGTLTMFGTFSCSLRETIFYSITAYTMQHMAASIAWWIALGGFSEYVLADFSRIQYFTYVVCAIEYAVLYLTLVKRIKSRKVELDALRMIVPSAVILFTSVVMNFVILDLRVQYPVIEVYHIAICMIGLFFQASLFRNSQLSVEKNYISYMLDKQKNFLEISKESIDVINVKCHDMKKQLATLSKITSPEMLGEYKKEVEESISDYDIIANTGNEALNIVLTERAIFCQGKNIKFSYMADGNLLSFMTLVDIYSMFANALDNCIEAAMQTEENKRVINATVTGEKNMVCIHFENYFNGSLTLKDGLPITGKDDKVQHGFGLKSIRMIVEKYGGIVSVYAEDDVFNLNILFSRKTAD